MDQRTYTAEQAGTLLAAALFNGPLMAEVERIANQAMETATVQADLRDLLERIEARMAGMELDLRDLERRSRIEGGM